VLYVLFGSYTDADNTVIIFVNEFQKVPKEINIKNIKETGINKKSS
jgi:hypothetical protein